MTVVWDQVHVADVLTGQDGKPYTVTERTPGPRWASAGAYDHFVLRHQDGREVPTTKRLIDPAPMAERADHGADAHAWQALTAGGFQLTMIGESMSADEFGDPAKRGKGKQRDDGIEFDRWDRYVLPHPETGEKQSWTRVTTLAKTLADTYGLNQWEKRMVAKGVGMREDLAALAAAADPEEGKATLERVAQTAKEVAGGSKGANMGTAFHAFAQRHDRGEPLASMGASDALAADVRAYAEALKSRSLRILPEYMERVVCILALNACGTLDRLTAQPSGPTHSDPLAVLDLKSAKDMSYSWMETAIQQACYANADYMWDGVNKCWIPMPQGIDKSRALIAHSPIGKGVTTVYGVDLVKGWKLAKASLMVRDWRKDTYSWTVAPDDPKTVVLHLISQAASREALGKLWEFHRDQFAQPDVMAAAQTRLATLETVTQ